MLNVGLPEFFLIAVLALLVVGPDRLPGLARNAAKLLARFRQEAGKSLSELRSAAEIDDVAKEVSSLRRELRATRSELTRSLAQPSKVARDTLKGIDPGGPTSLLDPETAADERPPMDPEAT